MVKRFRMVGALLIALALPAVCYGGSARCTVRYAQDFDVQYFDTYKIVTVKRPWRDAKESFQYVLVDRGTPPPRGFRPDQVFEVPVHGFVPLSTSFLPHVAMLHLQNELEAVSDFKFVNTPSVRALIDTGKLKEVGFGASIDFETLVSLAPGLVMVNSYGDPQSDAYPKLKALGIPVVVSADYMETTPLGRAEWVKFTALFFNKEAEAEQLFDEVATEYERLAALGRKASHKPTVLTGASWRGTWHVPGGNSYMARFLADAGGDYLWKDDKSNGAIPLDFETVFARARNADFWVNIDTWHSLSDMRAADERYGAFKAVQLGHVYNREGRVNKNGGNDFWETGIVQPQNVLADLLKIFHPDLLPEHQLIWYRQLVPAR